MRRTGASVNPPTNNSALQALPDQGAQPQLDRMAGLTSPTTRGRSVRRIGEVIVDLGFAEQQVVEAAVEMARDRGEPTGKVLLETGVLTADQLAHAVAERFGLDYVDLSIFKVGHGRRQPGEPGRRAPLPGPAGRLHRRAHAAAWRWRTRPTSSRSTTSR